MACRGPALLLVVQLRGWHRQASQAATVFCRITQARSAELLRLGLVMGLTMTLHNMPEGFAVSAASAVLGCWIL